MNIDVIEELASGDEERVLRIGESDFCAVVDWRDGAKEIVEAVNEFLPSGYLSSEAVSSVAMRIHAGGRPAQEILLQDQKQEPFINELNRIISPEFEMRQFKPFDGDSFSLLIRPTSWWSEATIQHPELIEQYFLTTERLAVFWSKSFFMRLFTKP